MTHYLRRMAILVGITLFVPACGRIFAEFAKTRLFGWENDCGSYEAHREGRIGPYQEDYGTAKTTVVSVIPWVEIASQLAPYFNLDNGDVALAKVDAVTAAHGEALLNTFTAAIGLGQSPSPSSFTPPGAPLSLPSFGDAGPGQNGIGRLSLLDPTTEYQQAAALYQQVQLLNNYINYVSTQGRAAYLVGVDVALLPARRAPVDATVDVSFYSLCYHDEIEECLPGKLHDGTECEKKFLACQGHDQDGVYAIPILSSDILELDEGTQLQTMTAQFAVAVQAVSGKSGGAVQDNLSRVQQTIGRDINSLQMVAGSGDSSLVMRFGAMNSAEETRNLVPLTRRVFVLMLVPDGYFNGPHNTIPKPRYFNIASRVTFTNADPRHSLQEIPGEVPAEFLEEARCQMWEETNVHIRENDEMRILLHDVRASDWSGFRDRLETKVQDTLSQDLATTGDEREVETQEVLGRAWLTVAHVLDRARTDLDAFRLPNDGVQAAWLNDLPDDTESLLATYEPAEGKKAAIIAVRVRGVETSAQISRWRLVVSTAQGDGTTTAKSVVRHAPDLVEVRFPAILIPPPPPAKKGDPGPTAGAAKPQGGPPVATCAGPARPTGPGPVCTAAPGAGCSAGPDTCSASVPPTMETPPSPDAGSHETPSDAGPPEMQLVYEPPKGTPLRAYRLVLTNYVASTQGNSEDKQTGSPTLAVNFSVVAGGAVVDGGTGKP